MKKFTRQELHQRAHDLTLELFRSVGCGPKDAEFELSVEIRKAAQDTTRHLSPEVELDEALGAASGSAARLECLLLLAHDLAFFPRADLADFQKQAGEIGAAVRTMISKLRASGS